MRLRVRADSVNVHRLKGHTLCIKFNTAWAGIVTANGWQSQAALIHSFRNLMLFTSKIRSPTTAGVGYHVSVNLRGGVGAALRKVGHVQGPSCEVGGRAPRSQHLFLWSIEQQRS